VTINTLIVCAALQFSQTLADLETAQSQVTTHLKSHTDVVKQVTVCSSKLLAVNLGLLCKPIQLRPSTFSIEEEPVQYLTCELVNWTASVNLTCILDKGGFDGPMILVRRKMLFLQMWK